MTLYALLAEYRKELVTRWSQQVRDTLASEPLTKAELVDKIPSFIDDIVRALHPEAVKLPGGSTMPQEHGVQRFALGFNIREVVREYGILLECILELARREELAITVDEYDTLSKYVNLGSADAVTEYGAQRDAELRRQAAQHLGFIAHELRNPLAAARLAFARIGGTLPKSRLVDVLDRSLTRISDLIDSVLTDAWLHADVAPTRERIALGQMLQEIQEDYAAEIEHKRIHVELTAAPALELEADRRMLRSALSNLVRNAIKFSREGATIVFRAARVEERVIIEVEDQCGGLTHKTPSDLFAPFVQGVRGTPGFGLGLAIAKQAAEAHAGTIKVRNLPGKGCIFALDLPITSPRPR